ncbi:MAG: hypothetical protein JWO89_424 [Verrucomicrobiaceae bacterium]|nr:hypothetical protein [Verrucomicrobiaceae bacterium]
MGAWAVDSFGNDAALDWVAELNDADDISILDDTLSDVAESNEELESPKCCTAIAAAEVLAAMRGKPTVDLPDEVTEFVARIKEKPPADLIQLAFDALERIKDSSELQELWAESDSGPAWLKAMADLEKRLS